MQNTIVRGVKLKLSLYNRDTLVAHALVYCDNKPDQNRSQSLKDSVSVSAPLSVRYLFPCVTKFDKFKAKFGLIVTIKNWVTL